MNLIAGLVVRGRLHALPLYSLQTPNRVITESYDAVGTYVIVAACPVGTEHHAIIGRIMGLHLEHSLMLTPSTLSPYAVESSLS